MLHLSTILKTTRIQRVVEDLLVDIRQAPFNQMPWLDRVPTVDATDNEILAKMSGKVLMADIVADDSPAPVRPMEPLRYQQTKIPNIKHGLHISQEMLNILDSIQRHGISTSTRELQSFDSWMARGALGLLQGNRQRKNQIVYAMLLDEFEYSKNGIIMSGMTWGMPSDLKLVPSDYWDDATNGDAVADMLALRKIAREKYGINLNRAEMSTKSFTDMINQTKFKNRAHFLMPAGVTMSNLPTDMDDFMRSIAVRLLDGMTIEIVDTQGEDVNDDGTTTYRRYLPEHYCLLSCSAFDGNPMVYDFASGIVTEGIVSNLLGSAGTFGPVPATRGPVAYAAPTNINANPPQIDLWSVERGFSRKHVEASTARIETYDPDA